MSHEVGVCSTESAPGGAGSRWLWSRQLLPVMLLLVLACGQSLTCTRKEAIGRAAPIASIAFSPLQHRE